MPDGKVVGRNPDDCLPLEWRTSFRGGGLSDDSEIDFRDIPARRASAVTFAEYGKFAPRSAAGRVPRNRVLVIGAVSPGSHCPRVGRVTHCAGFFDSGRGIALIGRTRHENLVPIGGH